METKTLPLLRGKRLRITELDDCGKILPTSRSLVTDGLISLSISAEVEEGVEILKRNASGNICINEKSADSFKRLNVEVTFCGVNPALVAMITNAKEYADYEGAIAGITVGEGEMTGKFALELWTGVAGQACGDTGEEASGYILLPLVNAGTFGDFEVTGEDSVDFSLANSTTKGGNNWGTGPYKVLNDKTDPEAPVASKLPTALDPLDHLLLIGTDVAPPPVAETPEVIPAA